MPGICPKARRSFSTDGPGRECTTSVGDPTGFPSWLGDAGEGWITKQGPVHLPHVSMSSLWFRDEKAARVGSSLPGGEGDQVSGTSFRGPPGPGWGWRRGQQSGTVPRRAKGVGIHKHSYRGASRFPVLFGTRAPYLSSPLFSTTLSLVSKSPMPGP